MPPPPLAPQEQTRKNRRNFQPEKHGKTERSSSCVVVLASNSRAEKGGGGNQGAVLRWNMNLFRPGGGSWEQFRSPCEVGEGLLGRCCSFFLSFFFSVLYFLFLLVCIQSFGERVRRERGEGGWRGERDWRNNGGREGNAAAEG